MNHRQKLIQKQFLNNEEAVIKRLNQVYRQSLSDVQDKIKNLQFDIGRLKAEYNWMDPDDPEKAKVKSMIQSKIYQKQYQEQLQRQLDGILKQMQAKQYLTVSDYLNDCYTDGFIGSIFDLSGQGVPLMMPINQEAMVHAVQLDSKISKGLYTRLGEDVDLLKKKITAQVSRSIATGETFAQTARQLAGYTKIGFNNAIRIARTEGHRIQTTAAMDALHGAKDRGADVVKQWDAALDARTRESHVKVDGEWKELEEKFSNGLMYPGDPHGAAAEVINCRCALLQRARWALADGFTKMDGFTGEIKSFDSMETYNEFKKAYFSPENKAYMKYVGDLEKQYGTKDFNKILGKMTDDEYKRFSALEKARPQFSGMYRGDNPINLQFGNKKSKQTVYNKDVGGVVCSVEEVKQYDFPDGTNGGVKKTIPATIYTTPDGTKFVYPKNYNKKNQTLTPEMAISTWQKVPQNIRDKIQKEIVVVDYYNPRDVYWKKVYKNFTHSYATGGETITFYRSANHDLDYLLFTYCHEGGHYIDYHLPGTDLQNRYCQQLDWQNAMAKDLTTSGKKSWRSYGENSPLEDFADSVGYFVEDEQGFTNVFPERSKLLKSILK